MNHKYIIPNDMIYPVNRKIKSIWEWVKKLQGEYLVKKQEIDNLEKRIHNIQVNIPEVSPTPPIPPVDKYGYIIIHCHNPEGKELNSFAFNYIPLISEIYVDGNYFIDGENDSTHNTPHAILVGNHIISGKYNNIVAEQSIHISEGITSTATLIFTRENYPLLDYISTSKSVNFTKIVTVINSQEIITEYADGGWVQAVHSIYFGGEPYTIIGNGISNMSLGASYSATASVSIEGIGTPSMPGGLPGSDVLGNGRCSVFNDLYLPDTYLNLDDYGRKYWLIRGKLYGEYPDFLISRSSNPSGYKWSAGDNDGIHYYSLERGFDTLVHAFPSISGIVSIRGEGSNSLTLPSQSGSLDIEMVSVPYDTLGTAI